jgi:hypothetical protein
VGVTRPGDPATRAGQLARAERAQSENLRAVAAPSTTIDVSGEQARALRTGTATIAWRSISRTSGGRLVLNDPFVLESAFGSQTSGPPSDPIREEALDVMRSPGAHVRKTSVHGSPAIEISSADGSRAYYVEPSSYRPGEVVTRGTEGMTRLRVATYEILPAASARPAVLSLQSAHPSARIDSNQADFAAAQLRLYPHG